MQVGVKCLRHVLLIYIPIHNLLIRAKVLLVKKGRQQRYREQNREELKQLEAERRKSKQNVPFQPTTSCSDFNSTEHVPHNENSSEK
ncbi:unnamed protein product [Macrosiphum euphorbiae]|uniref:Uncharacterized protein n=1 Tax=Macrosiphum euphorbiae TaxID=13131 RepID=A0AAV0XVT4_9HEMI|nr:unnamed protein product [Macrosiphum euphorbiae]